MNKPEKKKSYDEEFQDFLDSLDCTGKSVTMKIKCGNCKYFTTITIAKGDIETFCKPIKDKYGWEGVSKDQEPSVNCHLDKEELAELKTGKRSKLWLKKK